MATQKRRLRPGDVIHEQLMLSILKGIHDKPLVLKGGSALMLAYDLDRFSEDLDFDPDDSLDEESHARLESRIRRNMPHGIGVVLEGIDTTKDTKKFTRYRVRYQSAYGVRPLLLEISYKTPAPQSEIRSVNGLCVASLPRIVDQKLKTAHDGGDNNTRSKVRDLYDLDFVTRRWPAVFTDELASRLQVFAADPDVLESRYRADYKEDDYIPYLVELDQLVLRLNYAAEEIAASRSEVIQRIERISTLKDATGADQVFWRHADDAIAKAKSAGADNPCEADWLQAEDAAIRDGIAEGLSPESVRDAVLTHSPGAVIATRQAEVCAEIERTALEAEYGHSDDSPSL